MGWQETLEAAQATPPDPARLAAVVDGVLPGARIRAVERMPGGLGSVLHRLEVETGEGGRVRLVLRGLMPEWGEDAASLAREVATHAAMAAAGVAVPGVVWSDPEALGRPSMLLRHVPGSPMVVALDRPGMPEQLADVMASVHAAPPPAEVPVFASPDDHLRSVRGEEPFPTTSPDVDAVALVERLLAGVDAAQVGDVVTVHGDLHGGNVLWDGRSATVLDWHETVAGSRWFDEAYAVLDTWLAHGRRPALALRDAYRRQVDAPAPTHRWWDLLAAARALPTPARWLPAFLGTGCTHVTAELLAERYRAFTAEAMAAA